MADDLPKNAWNTLQRPARYRVKTQPRARPENVKERIVSQREFQNIRLTGEEGVYSGICGRFSLTGGAAGEEPRL